MYLCALAMIGAELSHRDQRVRDVATVAIGNSSDSLLIIFRNKPGRTGPPSRAALRA